MLTEASNPQDEGNSLPLLYTPGRDDDRLSPVVKVGGPEPFRSEYRRDIARLIHSPAFRRLQGKTQVFPEGDSDFFRNRLTHSLEVAQIAKSFAIRLNAQSSCFADASQKIDIDVVEFAALAHDLGHPPFGHNGEEALDAKMEDNGGFEGNAQTLHILARLEKKELLDQAKPRFVDGAGSFNDNRAGLNVTLRSLASVLKYDNEIPERVDQRADPGVQKGYYGHQVDLVKKIKRAVLGEEAAEELTTGAFKTIECSIMDISDDIAYSTYDVEDCFKAGILTPLSMFSLHDEIYEKVVLTVNKRLTKYYSDLKDLRSYYITTQDVQSILFELFSDLFGLDDRETHFLAQRGVSRESKKQQTALIVDRLSTRFASNGYDRTALTSGFVQLFMDGVEILPHPKYPQLHRARLSVGTFIQVEVLKNITFEYVIMSPTMQTLEYRGKKIIENIFNALDTDEKSKLLLPQDFRDIFDFVKGPAKKRLVCDYIAGMTDRYAWEFYNRIHGTNQHSIFRRL